MQFHLNGLKTGDPDVADPSVRLQSAPRNADVPLEVDVLIIGCGPAGLTLAAQLAAFPDLKVEIVEQKAGPLKLGQADGVACRTMEMFEAFGFSERVLKESCWISETTFWKPDVSNRDAISRHGRVQDVEDGLSDFPHVILNQARVHDFYLDVMSKSANRMEPYYSRRLVALSVDEGAHGTHPVRVTLERTTADGEPTIETVKARYVVGCDGARSGVRQSIKQELRGDSASQAWGVMDVLAVTDFPDIRMKGLIQSAHEGSIVLIPREGGFLVRVYVELDKLSKNERVSNRNITIEKLIAAAQRILRPYQFDVKEVTWWSVYEIGQRLCGKFDDVPDTEVSQRLPRIFIAGDACHTHSPKAGQGMNVSMQDSFNLGWKLAAVLQGRSPPALLHTYSAERQAIAKELIEFDREWAKMLSAPVKSSVTSGGLDPAELQRYFVKHGHYTAGTATKYKPSLLTAEPTHQILADGLVIGMRFHSAPVIRLADAKPMRLGDAIKADGRWRLFVFADASDPAAKESRLRKLCDFLTDGERSPVRRFTPGGADIDAVFDIRSIFQQPHRTLDLGAMPKLLLPAKGRYGLRDYEKMFCADLSGVGDIFDMRRINRDRGCVVIVRPDQYIAQVLPIDAHDQLATFFEAFML